MKLNIKESLNVVILGCENPFPKRQRKQNVLSFFLFDSMIDVLDVMRQLNWIWDKSDKPFSLALIRVEGLRTISVVSFSRCSNHEVEIIFCHLAKIGWGHKIGPD